jgi:hypothetical protein
MEIQELTYNKDYPYYITTYAFRRRGLSTTETSRLIVRVGYRYSNFGEHLIGKKGKGRLVV